MAGESAENGNDEKGSEETRRLFLALSLPKRWRNELMEYGSGVRKLCAAPAVLALEEWTNLHLTLRFLGDFPTARLPEFNGDLRRALRDAPQPRLCPGGLSWFDQETPRIVFQGILGETDLLEELQRTVNAVAQRHGCAPETFAYHPHVTLGRIDAGADADQRADVVRAVMRVNQDGVDMAPHHPTRRALTRFKRVTLYGSHRDASGRVAYRRERRYDIGDA